MLSRKLKYYYFGIDLRFHLSLIDVIPLPAPPPLRGGDVGGLAWDPGSLHRRPPLRLPLNHLVRNQLTRSCDVGGLYHGEAVLWHLVHL